MNTVNITFILCFTCMQMVTVYIHIYIMTIVYTYINLFNLLNHPNGDH